MESGDCDNLLPNERGWWKRSFFAIDMVSGLPYLHSNDLGVHSTKWTMLAPSWMERSLTYLSSSKFCLLASHTTWRRCFGGDHGYFRSQPAASCLITLPASSCPRACSAIIYLKNWDLRKWEAGYISYINHPPSLTQITPIRWWYHEPSPGKPCHHTVNGASTKSVGPCDAQHLAVSSEFKFGVCMFKFGVCHW